jgi:hypothetical protein
MSDSDDLPVAGLLYWKHSRGVEAINSLRRAGDG